MQIGTRRHKVKNRCIATHRCEPMSGFLRDLCAFSFAILSPPVRAVAAAAITWSLFLVLHREVTTKVTSQHFTHYLT